MDRPERIIFVILDAFPHKKFPDRLPSTLAGLASEGGRAPEGGRAVLSASTYPNHASFITGVLPAQHGILSNRVFTDEGFKPASEVGPAAPTLFDFCQQRGLRSLALFGDQNLVGACGAGRATAHWPPQGVLPDEAPKGRLGYGADRAVVAALDGFESLSADLLVLQLDEIDTARHLYGPWGEEVSEQCAATDAALDAILDRFRSDWGQTLVIVVSDHDHEAVTAGATDLAATARERGLEVNVDHDGTSALVIGDISERVLLDLPGVSGCEVVAPGRTIVWGEPGDQFGYDWGLASQHGSPRTRTQLAVVGGGHPLAQQWGGRIQAAKPDAWVWAQWIRQTLDGI